MKRFRAALWLDLRLQRRYGFPYAALFSTVVWIVFLRLFPDDLLPLAIPFLLFSDLAIIGYFFVAAQVLYEKDEATVFSLATTPLRFREYLASKLATLTLLACAAGLILLVVSGVAGRVAWLPLVGGLIATSLIATLAGFLTVAPFRSISGFLLPGSLPLVILGLPIFAYAGWIESPVFYLLPTQGALILLAAGFRSVSGAEAAAAVGGTLLWVALLAALTRPAYERFIVRRVAGG